MIKFEFDLDLTAEEISEGLKSNLNAAVASTASQMQTKAHEIVEKRLKSGRDLWKKGFQLNKVDDGFWVLSVEGKLANMMEDGFGAGEIKRMLLGGNRAKVNAETGKRYVDVPLAQDADAVTGNIGKTNIQVSQFKNADEMLKEVKMSDWKKGGIKKEQRIVKRIEDIIQTRKKNSSSTKFITIRRVSESSKGWPLTPYGGAKVLDELDFYLEKAFEDSLNKLL